MEFDFLSDDRYEEMEQPEVAESTIIVQEENTIEEMMSEFIETKRNPMNHVPFETSKDIEVQETVQQAMELDVAPCPTAKSTPEETKLWKFNKTTGYWKMERTMFVENAKDWLASFQKLYPTDYFKVSNRKPKGMPY